jgi:hypothetical protein
VAGGDSLCRQRGAPQADAGASWSPLGDPDTFRGEVLTRVFVDRVDRVDRRGAGTLYLGADASTAAYGTTGSGLFASHDGGASWRAFPLPPNVAVWDLAIDPVTPTNLLVAGVMHRTVCSSETSRCDVYLHPRALRSSDGGATWINLAGSFPDLPESGAFYAVRIDPREPKTVYLAGDRSYKSIDGGRSWTPIAIGPATDLELDPRSGALYAAGPAIGLLRSTDGQAWTAIGGLPGAVGSVTLDASSAGTIYAATFLNSVWVTHDGGTSWTRLAPGLTGNPVESVVIDPFDPTTLYARTDRGGGIFTYTLGR